MAHDRFDVVYIKNGDVVAQLVRSQSSSDIGRHSGPDAFLLGLLRLTEGGSVLLLSKGKTSQAAQHGPNLRAQNLWSGSSRITGLIAKPILIIRTFSLLLKAKPKWVLCGTTNEVLWASFAYAKLFKVPLIHSRHGRVSTGTGAFHRRFSTALDNACVRRVTGVLCHGPYLRRELQNIGVPHDKIWEFDVDLTAFREQAGSSEPISQKRIVLYSGRIKRLKGVFDLLDALEPRLKRDANLELVYVGQGGASGELERTIRQKRLAGHVRLLGRIPHHELANLMARSYVVVTPTTSRLGEGRCMVAMESLVLGVPVVAPDYGAFPYLVQHRRNGLLFEPDSTSDLTVKLNELLDDPALYASVKAGAKQTGDTILKPPLTFPEAVALSLQAGTSGIAQHRLQDT